MSPSPNPPPRLSDIEAWASMSAGDFLLAMRDGGGPDAPHVRLLGYTVAEVEPGRVTLRWEVPEPLLNPAGIAHGGFLVALLDDAAGMACASSYPRFVPQLTVQLHTDFLAPVPAGATYTVVGEVVRGGRRTSLADARVVGPDGAVHVRCSGIFQPNRRLIPRDQWEAAGLA